MSVMTLIPIALGAPRLLPRLEGVGVWPKRRLEDEELEWMCIMLLGAAVQGRWSGELGEAWTGRKNCWSERGEGMKSRVSVGGVLRPGTGGEDMEVGVERRTGRVGFGDDCFSKSEQ